jgi:hypothetical protein
VNHSPDATLWEPHKHSPSVLLGTVAAVGPSTNAFDAFGTPSVLVVDHDGRRTYVVGRHTLLDKELRRAQPRPSDVIRIRFLGRFGKHYEYKVDVRRATR